MRYYDTARDLQVFHFHNGARYTVWELVNQFGHVIELDGNSSEGFTLALRDRDGIGLYVHSGVFRTATDAKAACANALAVQPVKGLHYINRAA